MTLPFDKRLPDVAGKIRHRHQCLLDSDINAKEYMPLPPMLSFTRTKNLRDILVRAKLPPPLQRQTRGRPLVSGDVVTGVIVLSANTVSLVLCPRTPAQSPIRL